MYKRQLVQGARPLFFLDYIATGKLDPELMAEIVKGVADACIESGCALLGGETCLLYTSIIGIFASAACGKGHGAYERNGGEDVR